MQSRCKWDISSEEEEEEVDPECYDELLSLLIVHDHPAVQSIYFMGQMGPDHQVRHIVSRATNLTHILPTFGQPSLLNVGQ